MNKHSFSKTKTNVAVRNMIAAGLFAAAVMPASAAEFQIGDFDLSVNSTVSAGTSFRVENRDRALYGSNNVSADGARGQGFSNTGDDGNLNFEKGDQFSTIIKGVHDFELKKDNYGFFSRVKWFYDYTLSKEEVFHGHEPTGNARNQRLEDSGFHPYARFDGIDLLDAFGYINTNVGGMPLDLRLGKQVISWGESTFILSPIAGLNTIDVSAFRRPGAELKEGFTPSEMLYANLGLTDTTSLEGFVQLKWRKTVPEGCGTYFSSSDFASDGCDRLAFGGTSPSPGDGSQFGSTFVNRGVDRQPDDGGQFGFALRSYFDSLDAELGAYAMQYHSRLPLVSLKKNTTASTFGPASDAAYVIDYPEDLQVFGLSFATNVGGWAWSGEASMTKDLPIQINATDLLRAGLTGGSGAGGGATAPRDLNQRIATTPGGQIANGFDRFDVTQIQNTFIKTFDRALGSSQVVFVGEVAAVFVDDLPAINTNAGAGGSSSGIRYGRSAVFGGGSDAGNSINGFVTDFAWGYRLRTQATYRDVFLGTDLIPSIAWSHDVDGWSPEPGQAFNEGRQSVGLGLGFEFDANTKASITYTTFTNAADFDVLRDRDFVSLTASYSF
ncbi:MAG: DUF1302 domain-containing protein [Gammaproteobacteria bacterium]|uniref:DUF1302 domain-containing protein n=1 Tax=Limnobacter sp. TaxID=2003368 RepID=UPI001D8C1B79|nr:DUF1302 domain-containing protein [Limnobacter sp.]MBU0783704.1 DUF1302 domain-containing protein [Gammaproteobacteria bacterium]MBU0848688.1 DUF1302 domain-containing protein [Gammaproteobacteria bacterium]MBU1266594.1 DUF1302 domain-containing protein [Gammaproteobacteria bacterium]MBU1529170.1 DUF1302 domain-containing protein [Gammaproteobacteria bacterium]MBU1781070.1 DUF1302 domain-containing protein [Gammaproteobacteria bacterium]